MMPSMPHAALLLLVLLTAWSGACLATTTAKEIAKQEDQVKISRECAAVLVLSVPTVGLAAGAGMSYLATTSLCALGFCSTGVAGGSAAAWWQSLMVNGVTAGSTFAKLQSFAMTTSGGRNMYLAASILGGATGAAFVQDFCAWVDEAEPDSPRAKVVEVSLEAIAKGKQIKDRCDSSESCSAVASTIVQGAEAAADLVSAAKDYAVAQLTSPENHKAAMEGLAATRDFTSSVWNSFKKGFKEGLEGKNKE
jgi:hypothetical protein